MIFAAAAVLLAAGPTASPTPTRAPLAPPAIALVVLAEATDAGRMQAGARHERLESRLAASGGAAVLRRLQAASILSKGVAIRRPVVSAADQQKADALLERMTRAYYDGNLDEAAAKLGELSALIDSTWLPTSTNVAMLLWRAAIFQERGEALAAEVPVREAMVLQPRLTADERTYPPLLVGLVKKLAAVPGRPVTVTLTGIPVGAQALVDDNAFTTPASASGLALSLSPGRHRVVLIAAGHDYVIVPIDAKTDTRLSVPMPLALEDASSATLRTLPFRNEPGVTDLLALEQLYAALGAKTLVIVSLRATEPALAAIAFTGKRVTFSGARSSIDGGEGVIATWIEKHLPRRRTVSGRVEQGGRRFSVGAGLAGEVRIREITAAGGLAWTAAFPATGPRLTARGTWNRWEALAEGGWLLVPGEPVDVEVDGATRHGGGGSMMRLRAAGLWRALGASRTRLSLGLGALWDQHNVANGGPAGLFPSTSRLSPELLAEGHTRIRAADVSAGIAIAPFSFWRESPDGATGSSASVTAYSWRVRAAVPRGEWMLAAQYDGGMCQVRSSGTGSIPTDPPLRSTRSSEQSHGATVSFGREF